MTPLIATSSPGSVPPPLTPPATAPPQGDALLRFDGPEVILILAAVVLTLVLLGVFIYVFTRKEQ